MGDTRTSSLEIKIPSFVLASLHVTKNPLKLGLGILQRRIEPWINY